MKNHEKRINFFETEEQKKRKIKQIYPIAFHPRRINMKSILKKAMEWRAKKSSNLESIQMVCVCVSMSYSYLSK